MEHEVEDEFVVELRTGRGQVKLTRLSEGLFVGLCVVVGVVEGVKVTVTVGDKVSSPLLLLQDAVQVEKSLHQASPRPQYPH